MMAAASTPKFQDWASLCKKVMPIGRVKAFLDSISARANMNSDQTMTKVKIPVVATPGMAMGTITRYQEGTEKQHDDEADDRDDHGIAKVYGKLGHFAQHMNVLVRNNLVGKDGDRHVIYFHNRIV